MRQEGLSKAAQGDVPSGDTVDSDLVMKLDVSAGIFVMAQAEVTWKRA